jgi:transposase
MSEHGGLLIRSCLRRLACLEEELEELDREILRRMQAPPFQRPFALLQTLPGVGQLSAAAILVETGTDLAAFSTLEQDVQLGRAVPRQSGKRGHSARPPHDTWQPYLRTALVQCAWAASRKQDSVFKVRFQQLAPRCGPKRGIVAVAHLMLIILYCMLRQDVPFRGAETASHQRRRQRRAHHHVRCLRRLGVAVQVIAKSEPSPPDFRS